MSKLNDGGAVDAHEGIWVEKAAQLIQRVVDNVLSQARALRGWVIFKNLNPCDALGNLDRNNLIHWNDQTPTTIGNG